MSIVTIGGSVASASPILGQVRLNVHRVLSFKAVPVMDGSDQVADQIEVWWEATVNPGTQPTDVMVGDPSTFGVGLAHLHPPLPAAPEPVIGPLTTSVQAPHAGLPGAPTVAPASYVVPAWMSVLMQPRMRVRWSWQGQDILLCPAPGFAADALNGPFPLGLEILEDGFHSGKTWKVRYGVRCAVNRAHRYTARPSPIVSNQWGQEDSIDADYYLIRTTTGTTRFNAGLLKSPGRLAPLIGAPLVATDIVPADLFRYSIFPDVDLGMKREKILVKVDPDGVTVHWTVVDREVPLAIIPEGVTRIEAVHEVVNDSNLEVTLPTMGKINVQEIKARLSLIPDWGRDWLRRAGVPLPNWGGGLLPHPWERALLAATAISKHAINVRVWGHKLTFRNDLEDVARQLISQRIIPVKAGTAFCVMSQIKHDVNGTFIEASELWVAGPLTPLGSHLPNRTAGNQLVFGSDDFTPSILERHDTKPANEPPGDSRSRGHYLESIVTAALTSPHDRRNVPFPGPITALRGSAGLTTKNNAANAYLGTATPPTWPRPAP